MLALALLGAAGVLILWGGRSEEYLGRVREVVDEVGSLWTERSGKEEVRWVGMDKMQVSRWCWGTMGRAD